MRGGYRRLHEEQVVEAAERKRRVVFDLADAVLALQAVTERVEDAFKGMEGWDEYDTK
jgi:hypothetical protein